MSLTKFTTHLHEGRSWRHHRGGVALFPRSRHLENSLCQSGSCPPPRGGDIIKGSAPVQLDEVLTVPPLLPHVSPVLTECLQRVPDQSPWASWTEGGEGFARRARSAGHCGRKGTAKGTDIPN